ncbi:10968_t:CDS:2 [Rhizophagus irregularis]|nr:10968_t:CDS:2 [Rhizophagus irregularis]
MSKNSQRPLIPSINYDNHNEYKQRTINSSIKLNKFFGDKPPLDICVKEIEKEGLKAMLHSKIPLCYFLYSLLEEYSCENLVEQYESFVFVNSTQQYTTAQHIFDTYLTHNSQFEVNVDDKVRKSVISSIKSQRDPKHCFDEAKRAIFVLLEVSFARFIRSPMADLMKQEIGETTTHYTNKARDAAVILLFRYLEKKNGSLNLKPIKPFIINTQSSVNINDIDLISPLPSPSLSISRKRNDLINGSSSGGIDDEFDIWSNDDECIEMVNTGHKKVSPRDQLKKKTFRRPTIKSRRKIKGN